MDGDCDRSQMGSNTNCLDKSNSINNNSNSYKSVNDKNNSNTRSSSSNSHQKHSGPEEEKIKSILERTGYTLDVTTGQRKYGGPPPDWTEGPPPPGCEIFVGKIPKEIFEDELIPMFEKVGKIWDLRLMMDPLNNMSRGYAFVTYCNKDDAQNAVEQYNGHEIRKTKALKVNISVTNLRLFVGNIPKSKSKEEIYREFTKLAGGLSEVNNLNGKNVKGSHIEVSLAKPPSDRKKKEEVLRNRDRRVMLMMQQRAILMQLFIVFTHINCVECRPVDNLVYAVNQNKSLKVEIIMSIVFVLILICCAFSYICYHLFNYMKVFCANKSVQWLTNDEIDRHLIEFDRVQNYARDVDVVLDFYYGNIECDKTLITKDEYIKSYKALPVFSNKVYFNDQFKYISCAFKRSLQDHNEWQFHVLRMKRLRAILQHLIKHKSVQYYCNYVTNDSKEKKKIANIVRSIQLIEDHFLGELDPRFSYNIDFNTKNKKVVY